MARNYIDDLNNLYKTRVLITEDVGLGPRAENYEAPIRKCKCGEVEGEEAEECSCMGKTSEDNIEVIDTQHSDHYETGEHPEERASNMVKQNLYRIAKMSAMLYDIVPCDSEIEPWVADKITKASTYVNDVLGYKDYEEFKTKFDQDINIEEKTEQDLYKSIEDGGVNLISKIKELMKTQPKEKVETAMYGMIQALEA